jgi:hypothetical protein
MMARTYFAKQSLETGEKDAICQGLDPWSLYFALQSTCCSQVWQVTHIETHRRDLCRAGGVE